MEKQKQNGADKLKEITDNLEQGVKELYDSEKYKEYLNVLSKFHNYSYNNVLLISMQKPDSTYVAGYSSWKQNFDRNVLQGEKAIKIIAPSPYKVKQEVDKLDANGNKIIKADGTIEKEVQEIIIPNYRIANVFDISQTEGKELPSIVNELQDSVKDYKQFLQAIKAVSPVPISFEDIHTGAKGYYDLTEKRIVINNGMSEQQNVKTLIHEVAHSLLHDKETGIEKDNKLDKQTKEVQAESIAYVVCQKLGIDTSDYSFGYIAGWSSDKQLDELKASLNTIRSCASTLIEGIEKYFKSIEKTKEAEKEKSKAESIQQHHKCSRSR